MGLLAPLLLLHLPHQLHQLLHREQDAAAISQVFDRCVEVLTGRLRKPTETGGINLTEQIEQSLTGCPFQQFPQHLEIESLLPVQGDGPQPAQPLKACQLF